MPRMRCPGCRRILQIDESSRGEVVSCPKCQRRFAVPRYAEDDELLEEEPESYAVQQEPEAPRPAPPPRIRLADDEDDDRSVQRRRKRRRRGESDLPDILAQWNLDKALLVGSVGVWFVLLGLAVIHPAFSLGLVIGGVVLILAARVWGAIAASAEGDDSGCLMLLFPWYFLINVFNLEDRRPLFLLGIGVLYLLTGVAVLTVLHGHL